MHIEAGKLHPCKTLDIGFTLTSGLEFQIPDVEGSPFSSALSLCEPQWTDSDEHLP